MKLAELKIYDGDGHYSLRMTAERGREHVAEWRRWIEAGEQATGRVIELHGTVDGADRQPDELHVDLSNVRAMRVLE